MDVVMFIKRSNGNNQFVSPFSPAMLTLPGVRAEGQGALDRVASALAAALYDPAAPSQTKLEAIWDLRDVSARRAIAGLHAALRDADRTVQLEAAARLLKINDIEGLPLAEDALLRKSSADSMSFNNVKWALREVRDPRAIPALARIVKRGDAETRREATEALGKTKSRNALQPLGEALNDDDHEVRLNAVRALANVTGDTQFRLSDAAFVEREARIIAEWKARLARLGVTIP
jgi:HEAT repeat protein